MKFKSATIKDFKRFTYLTVEIPEPTAHLIMLVGPNGCGKSSFFDALYTWHKWTSKKGQFWEQDYHSKAGSPYRDRWNNDDIKVDFYESIPDSEKKKRLYFRSAYRNDPEFQIQTLQRMGDPLDQVPFSRMIDNDAAVARNFQLLASQAMEDIFEPKDDSIPLKAFKEQIIGDIRRAFSILFSDVELNGLGNPLKDGTFRFTKGTSKGFSFKNLSGGEKAAFDLILDLVIARRSYNDTVFCIDEPESHMNARLQAGLLSVLYDLIPENCQLMLATHSIGMMRRAKDIEAEHPGSVVFLSFGDLDFDQRQVIKPKVPDRTFWSNAYDVALDDLAALVAPDQVIICEGEPKNKNSADNYAHDARCYQRIFETEFPETQFVPGGSAKEVAEDKRGVAYALGLLVQGVKVVRLIDRDDRSNEEISDARKNDVRVLTCRNLESYIFDDEVLKCLAVSVDKGDKAEELCARKKSIQENRPNDPPNDLKPASGEIYVACKDILGLAECGSTTESFMRDTLAPLIRPDMGVYKKLRRDIFDPESHGEIRTSGPDLSEVTNGST